MKTKTATRPSQYTRDSKYYDPQTPPFQDENGGYHVFSYADVNRVLLNRDKAFSIDMTDVIPDEHSIQFDFMWMMEDVTLSGQPGRHAALRGIVEPFFQASATRMMEPIIRTLARDLIDRIVDNGTGEFDLARDLAYPLSFRTICRLIGIDVDREQWVREKTDAVAQAQDWTMLPYQWDLAAYLWKLVARRSLRPRTELMDLLLNAWRDGEIADHELLGYLAGFISAGTDTAGTALALAFPLLAEFDQLHYARRNLDDSVAMTRIVEEILRYGTPFSMNPINVTQVTQFGDGDLTVPAGSILHIWYSAANRDPEVNGDTGYVDPTIFDPQRWPNRHLALGRGKHYCLGAELARLEIRILLQEGLRRLPGLRMAEDQPFRRNAGIVDYVAAAPMRFEAQLATA